MRGGFLDSNVLIYAFTTDQRALRAQELLESGCAIGVQGVNEFTNVAKRKLGMKCERHLRRFAHSAAPVLPLEINTHTDALRIAERYGYGIFDALMLASALSANCRVLWSQDIQDGAVIGGPLRIANPVHAI